MQEPHVKQFRQQAEQYFRKRVAPQEVDDLVQDMLYRLLVAEARNLKITAQLVSHLCHAVWVDYLRQQMRRAERECALGEDCGCLSWEAQVILSVDAGKCLEGLTASERQLVQWHWVEGETCAVIGERLGIGEEAVKKRLQRVKQKLCARLADYGGGYVDATSSVDTSGADMDRSTSSGTG
ncbi:MAG: sigma-70 family RNA polymerase sigma factor [Firmicutes bacterium]|nr:sigma-70 family RNA polymerase sigma factor [Bacillota bacterium]